MGVAPWSFTLRELLAMSLARLKSEWDRTAALICKVHNVNCAKKSDLITDPRTLNPLRNKSRRVKVSVAQLREAYTGRKSPLGDVQAASGSVPTKCPQHWINTITGVCPDCRQK